MVRHQLWAIGALGILNSYFTSCFTWYGTPERDGSRDKRAFIRVWCNGSTARKREKAKGQPTGLHLAVMDSTATSLAMDNNIPVLVFALAEPENIVRVLMGEKLGTLVK